MTPEERFERIETNLERLTERMNAFEAKRETDMADWRTRHDALEVEREVSKHDFDQRHKRLLESQSVLMESQSATFAAIDNLTKNIEKLIQGRGPNGHEL